jgi:MSHA biogenesis protein MshL
MTSKLRTRYFTVTALALLLASCTMPQTLTSNRVDEAFHNNTPPVQKTQLSVNQSPVSQSRNRAGQKFFNVSVHNLDAREFFMGLVMDSNENVVVHPDVSGVISLELKNVTLPDVIKLVSKVYGYDYEKNETGYIIYPAVMRTKTFKINRLDLLREGLSNTRISSGQNSITNNNSFGTQGGYGLQGGYGNQQSGLGASIGGNNLGQLNQATGSSVRTTSNTDFWKELTKSLQEIIAVDEQATVSINQQSGVVVVRAKPMQLREIESFLNTTQNQISRQVILEAKIIEVTLSDSHQDGINWKMLSQNAINVFTAFGVSNPAPFTTIFGTSNPNKFTAIFAGDFSAMVGLLSTQGKTNVLSSPKISTLNNQKAIIRVGTDEYFMTGVSSNNNIITGGVATTSAVTPTMASFFSGIALDVTPQIDDKNNIALHIHPAITDVTTLDKTFTTPDGNYTLSTPLNEVRESDNIVTAQSGQLVVLGGLMQENTKEKKEGVTGFAAIPYIGHLFRMDTGKTQKSELVILLKATVIDEPSDWQENIDASKQRYQQLDAKPRWQ